MRFAVMDGVNIAVVAGVVSMIVAGQMTAAPGVDQIVTGSIGAASDRFTVIDHAGGNTCTLNLKRADGYDVHMVEPGAGCGRISDRLASSRAWQENSSGTVTLTDASGTPLMRLAPADGMAYEVIEPREMVVSLAAF